MPGASALRLTRPVGPAEFEKVAGPFLGAREAENNLTLGLVAGLKAGRAFGPLPPFFAVVRDDDRVIGAAMRTPPLNLIIAAGTEQRALPLILDGLESETTDIPGMSGPKALVARAAHEWSERHDVRGRVYMQSRIYQLTRVRAPRLVGGRMRVARPDDLQLVASWFQAFLEESQPSNGDAPALGRGREHADHWIASGGLRIWDDARPVAMAGAGGPTPHGIRVSAVFTPPESRRRGYASALVAALSQEQLDRGRRFCFLFTDLANPTANHIYQDIGYEPVIDADEWRFSSQT